MGPGAPKRTPWEGSQVCTGTSLKRLPRRKPSFSKPCGQGHGGLKLRGPSQGGSVSRFQSSGRKGRSFHREVSVRSESGDSRCQSGAKKLSRELLLFLVNQHLPWDVAMETGRKGLGREPTRVSWVVKGHTCSGGRSCQPCRSLGRCEGPHVGD